MKKLLIIGLVSLALFTCQKSPETKTLKSGSYRFELETLSNQKLPFILEVEAENKLKLYNGEEVIEIDEVAYRNDSIFIKAPVFEGYFAAVIEDDDGLNGIFIKKNENKMVPFTAIFGETKRFDAKAKSLFNVSGTWETVFNKGTLDKEYFAKGVFTQKGDIVTGTFRTTTGDYRFLEGVVDGDSLKISAFDGSHAFLFTAKVTDSTMQGAFYSGNHYEAPFEAKRNEDFELPEADELTYLNDGFDKFAFEFPDESGKLISLDDERFTNKVVIVQIMGTWCPNCLDETKYYNQFYETNKDKDFEIVALAFEYAKTPQKAFESIGRLKTQLNVNYPILLAQYGGVNKTEAQKKLPMLNHILSYPTSIFIDKTGKVRKIHTGFNGPATGEKYVEFTTEFETFINTLLKE